LPHSRGALRVLSTVPQQLVHNSLCPPPAGLPASPRVKPMHLGNRRGAPRLLLRWQQQGRSFFLAGRPAHNNLPILKNTPHPTLMCITLTTSSSFLCAPRPACACACLCMFPSVAACADVAGVYFYYSVCILIVFFVLTYIPLPVCWYCAGAVVDESPPGVYISRISRLYHYIQSLYVYVCPRFSISHYHYIK